MIERIPKSVVVLIVIALGLVLACIAYSRPGYFTSEGYLQEILMLELCVAAVWLYRKVFYPIVISTFLLAGVDLPVGSIWTMARWGVLGLGALIGTVIMLKERRYRFGMFHVLAFFAVLAALVSAAVSRYTMISSLKVLSLLLLFVYAATGVRVAVIGRENRFFSGLLLGTEILVGLIGAFYLMGVEALGNPNSLGAVMGVAGAPILLWGMVLPQESVTYRRRLLLFGLAMYLAYASHARAALLAGFISCALLCLALRRYALLAQGVGILAVLIAAGGIVNPEAFSRTVSNVTSTVLFKGKDPSEGLLASRKSPWQDSVDAIRDHFWFGTGFGTADNGQDATEEVGKFSSHSSVTAEHGSSYLAITSWVGILGVVPFALVLGVLLKRIFRALWWMWRTGNPVHPAVPLTFVLLAGMMHAVFEDWMFAPGYYLCIFYWTMAFVFVDQTALMPIPESVAAYRWRAAQAPQAIGTVAPSR